jgi:hypothetical protein
MNEHGIDFFDNADPSVGINYSVGVCFCDAEFDNYNDLWEHVVSFD